MATSVADMGSAGESKTPAQLMQEQHEAAQSHHATVEDTVDEEDLAHPTSFGPAPQAKGSASFTNGTGNGVMSEKAAGKQKAGDTPTATLDTQSEDLFPSLGSGPKPRLAANPPSWAAIGKKKASSTPVNGESPAVSRPSSASSTTGHRTPAVSAPAVKPQEFGQAPAGNILPGQFRDTLTVPNAQIDGSKPIAKFLQDIYRKTRVRVESTTLNGNNVTFTRFTATGSRKKDVDDALKLVSRELTKELTKQITIPAALKSHVIGRAGANVVMLQKKHDVKIQLQDRKEMVTSGQATATVEIKGRARDVAAAEREILEMVKERQPRVNLPLHDVDPRYYPFISGQHASRIQQWEDRDVKVQIPEFDPLQISPSTIIVSGEHEPAAIAHAEVDALARQIQAQMKTQTHPFDRSLHPFIVGSRGMSNQEFMQETGCIVVLPDDDSEDVMIIGPEDRLEDGYTKAMDLASQIFRQQVDLHRAFSNVPQGPDGHSRALAEYLKQKQIEKEMRDLYEAELVFPAVLDQQTTWNVFAQDSTNALRARSDLMKVVQAYPPERFSLFELDPFFHPHLERLCAEDLRKEYNVHMIIPDNESHVVLVYEGEPNANGQFEIPRQKPTAQDISQFDEWLRRAEYHLMKHTGEETTISNLCFDVPKKYHEKVRKFVKTVPEPTPPEGFPVNVEFGPRRRNSHPSRSERVGSSDDTIYLSGQGAENVDAMMKVIMEQLKQIEEDEKTRSYTTSFPFPDKFKNFLIGKQGASINQLREKHDVEIDTKESEKVTIKGPQKHADACRAEITQMAKQWADEVTYKIKVEPRFFGTIIGKNGEHMTRWRNKVDNAVVIQLPPKAKFNDSQSTADTSSDVGSNRNFRANQAPDEIIVRGPRQKADMIKSEIEELYKYEKAKSHEATVSVAKDQIRLLLGKGGREMEKLRIETDATINIPKNEEADPTTDRVNIRLQGTKEAIEKAKAELLKRSKAFDAVVTRKINIDQKYHRSLIGPGGSNIRKIVTEAGGPENSAEAVQFSKQGSSTDEVTVSGTPDVVNKIVAALESFAIDKENETTESIDVPQDQHHKLIGRGGETRHALEAAHKVKLDIPRRNEGTTVKITGPASNVSAAKKDILERTAKPTGETINVPRSLHHIVGNNGQLFRELRNKNVIVEHGGQKPPPKPTANADAKSEMANGSMPLITDDSDAMPFQWKIVESETATNGDAGTIPWILMGSADDVSAARARIEKLLATASEPRATGYLRLSDPAMHRHIIGRGGSKINEIRKKAGCDIQVPKSHGNSDDAITIIGDRDGCEQAKALILEAVQRGESGNGGGARGSGSPRF